MSVQNIVPSHKYARAINDPYFSYDFEEYCEDKGIDISQLSQEQINETMTNYYNIYHYNGPLDLGLVGLKGYQLYLYETLGWSSETESVIDSFNDKFPKYDIEIETKKGRGDQKHFPILLKGSKLKDLLNDEYFWTFCNRHNYTPRLSKTIDDGVWLKANLSEDKTDYIYEHTDFIYHYTFKKIYNDKMN